MNRLHVEDATTSVLRVRKIHALAILLVVSLMAPALSFNQPSSAASIKRAASSSVAMRLRGGGFGYSRQLLPNSAAVFANLRNSTSKDKSNNSVEVEVDESSRFIRHKADLSIQSKLPTLLGTHLTGACGTLDNTRAYKGLVFKCIADANMMQSRKNSWALVSVNRLTKVKTLLLSCQDPGKKGYVATKTVKGVTYNCSKVSGVYVWLTSSQTSLISLPSRGSAPAVSTIPSAVPAAATVPTTTAPNAGGGDGGGSGGGDGGGGVSLLSQSITFDKFPATSTYGDALLEVVATSNSGLSVSLSVSYESERICSIAASGFVETLSSGVCTIVGSQSGGAGYASASEMRKSFTINKASQIVTFANPGNVTWSNDLMSLVATSSASLPVSFASDSETVCTVVDGSVQMVKAGDCTISASQAGNDQYAPAQVIQRSFAVGKASQSITFDKPADVTWSNDLMSLVATSSASLPVSFASDSESVCTVVDGSVQMVKAGDCTISASQAGNDQYAPAQVEQQTFAILRVKGADFMVCGIWGGVKHCPDSVQSSNLQVSTKWGSQVELVLEGGYMGADLANAQFSIASADSGRCVLTGNILSAIHNGHCAVTVDLGETPIFQSNQSGFGVVFAPRSLQISAHAKSKKYGEADPELTYTVGGDGLVDGDVADVTMVTTSNGHAGRWQVQITDVQVSSDYVVSDLVFADFDVAPRNLVISAHAKSKKYGEADPALTYTVGGDGLVGTDTLSGELAHTSNGHAGNWKITQGSLAASSDYVITGFDEANLVVNKRGLVVSAAAKSKKYGEADPALTYTVGGDGLVGTDTLSGELAHTSNGHAGNWKITQGSLVASNDYEITGFDEADFTVNQRPINVVAAAKSKKYGEADPALTYTVGGDGLVGADTLSGELAHTSNGHVGNWKITQGSLVASSDYVITGFDEADFAVNQRPITVVAAAKSKKYGDVDPELTYTVGGDGLVGTDTLSGALAHTSNGHAGTWSINQGNLDNSDYKVFFLGATYVVNQRPITVVAAAKSKKYGEADPALTYTVGGDGLVGIDTLSGELAHTSNGHVGNWEIIQGNLDNSDYNVSFTGASFVVNQRPINVVAAAKSKKYGEADPALTYTVGGDGLVGADTLSGELAHTSNGHVGNWKITQGSLVASSDYVITGFDEADFTVNQRPINVVAAAKSKKYGEADPALTYTVGGDGLVGTDTLSGELAHTSNGHAGTWAINQGSISASSDYNLSFTGASFVVNQRPITVVAAAKSKKYGEADPALTYTVGGDGLVGADTLSGELAHTSNGHAGTWSINQGNLGNSDYSIAFTGATYVVNQRPITVVAAAKSKKYGDVDPELTYTVGGDGLVGADTLSGALAHNSDGHAGTWSINKGSLGNSDYSVSFTGATFTVNPREVSLVAVPTKKKFKESDPALTYVVNGDGLVAGDSVYGSVTRAAGEAVGKYPIQIGDLVVRNGSARTQSADYVVTKAPADFEILIREITITATAATKQYSDADPTLTYTLSGDGLATGDSLSGALSYTGSNVGTYVIGLGSLAIAPGANASNYSITYVSASMTITQKTRTGSLTMPTGLGNFRVGNTATATASANGDGVAVWSGSGACSVSSAGVITGTSTGSCTVRVTYNATTNFTSWTTSSSFTVKA